MVEIVKARDGRGGVTSHFLQIIGYPYPNDLYRQDNPLNYLGVPVFSAETQLFLRDLFLDFVKQSGWKEEDKTLWIMRYMQGKPPRQVARLLKRKPQWVYTKYYRLKKRLAVMVRNWWENTIGDKAPILLPMMMENYLVEKFG
ncbi:MAG: sigma-70 family RNA polymerase sigma factor [Bacteroidaceae bacterium]|nr:sigma-70 family RNA polymerase sigma factor [Bacteroidaceae bacterium]